MALFFGVSGFVMTVVLDSGRERGWGEFAARRVIRIVPLAWLMTTVKLLVATAVPTEVVDGDTALLRVVASYPFLPAVASDGTIKVLWGVEWTLLFEVAFYAVLTLALALRADPVRFATPILVAVALAALWRLKDGGPWWFYADAICLFFVAGMWVARGRLDGRRRTGAVAVGTLAALYGVIEASSLAALPGETAVFVGVVGMLAAVVALEPWIARLRISWVLTGGAASYALYLTHPVTVQVLPEVLERAGLLSSTPWPVVVVAATTTAVIAAVPIHRAVERPLTRLAARILTPSDRSGARRRDRTRR